MKKRISLAFVMLAIAAVFSLTNLSALLSFAHGQGSINALYIRNKIFDAAKAIMPFAFTTALYLNTKQDAKKPVCTLLAVYAVIMLASFAHQVFGLNNYPQGAYKLLVYFALSAISYLLMGVGLLFAMFCVKRGEGYIKVYVVMAIAFVVNLFCIVVYLLPDEAVKLKFHISELVSPLLLAAGIALLPKTVVDYNNCVFAEKKTFLGIGAAGALVAIALFVGMRLAGSSGGCDYPNCDNPSKHKGKYGGAVYFCDEHKDTWYMEDPRDGGIIFHTGK